MISDVLSSTYIYITYTIVAQVLNVLLYTHPGLITVNFPNQFMKPSGFIDKYQAGYSPVNLLSQPLDLFVSLSLSVCHLLQVTIICVGSSR